MDLFNDLVNSFRVADAFDIAFVAVFLYATVSWFKETASRSVVIGVLVLAGVYLLARALDMYMTATLFQAAFAVLVVALVVVFQEDLRRGFERIATLGRLPQRRKGEPTFPELDLLVETASQLASKRVGALIVVKGRDPLERHLDGGINLEGRISRPLLDSIFDPHSMGHDGAVIIADRSIRQFAAHLPLSRNLKEVGHRGTRHSAALGLSEVCDALVIVVSEERGEISVAEGGMLKTLAAPAELKRRLQRFADEHHVDSGETVLRRMLQGNLGWKIGSLAAACLAWFLLSFEAETVQKTFVVPIEYRNVPEDLVIEEATPVEARITLTGYERAFNLLSPGTLRIAIELEGIGPGIQQVVIEDEDVKRPSNLELYRVEPTTVLLDVAEKKQVDLSVEAPTEGRLPPGLTLESVRVSPQKVTALVRDTRKSPLGKLRTEPIDLGRISETTTLTRRLQVPTYIEFPGGSPPEVRVVVAVRRAGAGG